MSVAFKPDETFRDDFTFRNSPQAIRRFPLPFPEDKYMYSVNIEAHRPGPVGSVIEFPIDVDEHYVAECRERALVLQEDPLRFQAMPHMMSAQWDCLELIMESLSRDYPQHFTLDRQGNRWVWTNRPLGIHQAFTFGDPATLPQQPLDYITRQVQGDWVVMDQREGDLWAEAGMVTTQADWSLNFDIGMSFKEWHGPVPLAHEMGVFDRALQVPVGIAPERAGAAFELDHDRQSAARYLARDLPQVGDGSRAASPRRMWRQGASACRAAGVVASPPVEWDRLQRSGLSHQHAGARDYSEVGETRPSSATRPSSGAHGLQGAHTLPGHGGRVSRAFRRRRADFAGYRAGITAQSHSL